MKSHFCAALSGGIFLTMLAGYSACAYADVASAQSAQPVKSANATDCKSVNTPVKKHVHKIHTARAKTKGTHGLTSLKVRAAQMRLSDLGYFVGYYDGAIGPKTRKAILSFQRIHHIRPTGTLTDKTFETLCMTDYLAHHYYLTSVRDPKGVTYAAGYPYNRPGHINPETGAWTVNGTDRSIATGGYNHQHPGWYQD